MILISILLSVLGAWVTFELIKKPRVSPTQASSLVSLVGFLILYGLHQSYEFNLEYYCSLLFGATFVGMCSGKLFKNAGVILGAGLYTTFYQVFMPHSFGVGGALGFSAFLSILIIWVLQKRVRIFWTGTESLKSSPWSRCG